MRDIISLGFNLLTLAMFAGCSGPPTAASMSPSQPTSTSVSADRRADCLLIDSDAGLDDLRAIAALAPHRRISGVVVTEGLATPRGGARALRTFLRGASIPVVEGVSPAPTRELDTDRFRGLDAWRLTAETLNGTLPPPDPIVRADEITAPPVEAEVERLTAGCARLALLAIGPWTSFLRYEKVVGERLVHVVAQGSPFPDDEARGEPDGWNCRYDWAACRTAFTLLGPRGLRADWVDIPQGPRSCGSAEPGQNIAGEKIYAFVPDEEMRRAFATASGDLPKRLEQIMRNPTGLKNTSLWDDLAALYLLRPDMFGRVRDPSGRSGGHLEPCLPAREVRAMLVAAAAGNPLNAKR